MQSILREKLLAQSFKLAEVSKIYRTDSHRFVDAYLNWLEEAEKDLASLRSPINILLHAEKSALTSILEGNLPHYAQEKRNTKKYQRAAAAESMERILKEFYSKIESIDQYFDRIRENLCQTIAILTTKDPNFHQSLEPNQQGVKIILKKMSQTPETIQMYNYFSAKLASTDVKYLIVGIIMNIIGNGTNNI
ncbi:MAG: hypothetical protein FH758_09535 [Firmicutes bacterium]|nr:hypothetical protein [Bacillota bacterium]